MKKLLVILSMVMVFACSGMNCMAASAYDNYDIIINGIEKDIAELEDEEDIDVLSVEKKEFPSEKVCVYRIKLDTIDGRYEEFIYINGESDEVYAILYNADGEIEQSEVMTLAQAAEDYK